MQDTESKIEQVRQTPKVSAYSRKRLKKEHHLTGAFLTKEFSLDYADQQEHDVLEIEVIDVRAEIEMTKQHGFLEI